MKRNEMKLSSRNFLMFSTCSRSKGYLIRKVALVVIQGRFVKKLTSESQLWNFCSFERYNDWPKCKEVKNSIELDDEMQK